LKNLHEKTAYELAEMIRTGSCTPDEALADLGASVAQKDKDVRAYVRFFGSESRRSDKKGPLAGVPVSVKDNMCVEGKEITCSSNILKGYIAPYDATAIRKLLDAGATIAGTTNMDEFAFGSSCETSAYGPTFNPRFDRKHVPGGSSGGAAAAVADHTAYAALGSDTGGSIRQPAAFCGVVGMKPTYGRVSRYGLIAFASSLDQIGPITKDVRDNALLLNVLAGHDPKDSTSAEVPVPDYLSFLNQDIKGLRIGVPKEYFAEGLKKDVEVSVRAAIEKFKSLGATVTEVSLPHTKYAVSVYYIVAPSEASSNLARFDGVRFGHRDKRTGNLSEMYERSRGEGFGAEAKRRIILGTYSLSSGYYDAYYLRAMKVRTKIKNDFDEAFKKVDVLVTPTAPSAAFRPGEKTANPLEMYLSDIYTISVNLAGVPALSMPCGASPEGLPFGLQLIGKPFDEGTLYKAAHAFERATDFHKKLGNVK
jgi:aspartyl-tRNA(Asn)/glutamyl-tRNA(Gln) amidotransferase subunit A